MKKKSPANKKTLVTTDAETHARLTEIARQTGMSLVHVTRFAVMAFQPRADEIAKVLDRPEVITNDE